MGVTHTVLFQFKAELSADDVKAVRAARAIYLPNKTQAFARFLALKDTCIHATTGDKYIISLKGGKDNSPENMQGGLTHGVVAEFASAEDRDYYITSDPVHQEFMKFIGGLLEKAVVVDFADGVY